MNKKMRKFLLIVLSTCIMIIAITSKVFATNGINLTSRNEFKDALNLIIDITEIIALGIASIMLIVLAIKYMVSAPNDKAEIKKHAVVYIVGAVFVFGATGIVEIIKMFTKDVLG